MATSTLVDLVKIYATNTGTGAITLGTAVPGYRGREVLVDGRTYSYAIQQEAEFEYGRGIYQTAGLRLVRTVMGSSNGGAPINLSANARIAFVALADDYGRPGEPGPPGPPGPAGDLTYADLASLQDRAISASYGATNPNDFGVYVESEATGKQVDGIYVYSSFYGDAAKGYPFHGVAYADEGVIAGGLVGGGGFAIGGPGAGSGGIGNRREAGPGHGLIGTRDGTGAGHGVVGTAQGTGTNYQAGVSALKQNVTGAPGGDSSPGAALAVINSADQGRGIESTTLANNADDVSNFYERRNVTRGVVSRRTILLGGARTSTLVVDDILIQPAAPLSGAFPVVGSQVTIRDQIQGATEATAYSASNDATGGIAAFGLVANVTGENDVNTAGRFLAQGGDVNYSIDCAEGVALFRDGMQALDLPVFADNAAAATGGLDVGQIYRTATGVLMVAFSV